jgi:hypothetical protein
VTSNPAGGHIQLFSRIATGPVRWRLLSGNNRETGRSADSFPDVETCRIAVKDVQNTLDDLQPSVRRTNSNEWAWQLTRNGQLVVVSGRGFDRLIRCEQGLEQFLRTVRDAEIGAPLMVSHARRW